MMDRLDAALSGRYSVVRELGQGGMATVYLARDLKHDRDVALKVLKPELAALMGGERFLAEIRTTANLQHPHILPLFDSGEADGFLFYVMPYIQGETLRHRLRRERQLPVDEAVRVTASVAGALDYAHRHEVVHRDIKPENILLHEGEPLVADFGIALAVSAAGGGRLTETGLSLGTPHYMSPEQASADRDASPRSDVYALGCVLYEMLTGDPPHTGPTSHVILMRILTEVPRSVSDVRRSVPLHVTSAVARALEKLPADRFESAEAFRAALTDEHFRHTPPTGMETAILPAARASTRLPFRTLARDTRFLGLAAVAVGGLTVGTWGISWMERPPAEPVVRISTPLGAGLGGTHSARLAISPAGDRIAWVQEADSGRHHLVVRRSDETTAVAVSGGEYAESPTFSPDGEWLAFVNAAGDLVKVSVGGGRPTTIAPLAGLVGLHWGDSGFIVGRTAAGILAVPEAGGEPRLLVEDPWATWPELLPGGRAVVYTARNGLEGDFEIRVADLESGQVRTVVADATHPHYLESGHLVWGHPDQTLFAAPFDIRSLNLTGPAVPVLEPVRVYSGGAVQFAVSRNGTAVYVSVPFTGGRRELVVIDRDGHEEVLPLAPGSFSDPRWAPDGQRIAYATWGDGMYIYSTLTGAKLRVEVVGFPQNPLWSADGTALTFSVRGPGTEDFDGARAPADGSGPPQLLFTRPNGNFPEAWLPDGRLLVRENDPVRGRDLLIYEFGGDSVRIAPYLTADWEERAPALSPDASHVAYTSDESGRDEVYVRTFPRPSEKVLVSRAGGTEPRWSPDGRTLYYREGTALVAARLGPGPMATVSAHDTISAGAGHLVVSTFAQYDVHPDGDRFVVVRHMGRTDPAPDELIVAVHWFRELEERLGIGNGAPWREPS